MLTIGALVLIIWPGTELHLCSGKLVAQEQQLTAIKDLSCPDGSKFEDAIGVDVKYITEVGGS